MSSPANLGPGEADLPDKPAVRYASLRRAVSWGLVVIASVFIVRFFARNRADLDIIGQLSVPLLLSLVGAHVLYLLPQAYRYRIVIERQSDVTLQSATWFRVFVVGRLLNTVASQAGNVYRSARLKIDSGIGVGSYVGGLVAFTWLSITVNVIFAVLVAAVFDVGLAVGDYPVLPFLAASAVLVAVAPFALHGILGAREIRLRGIERARQWVHDIVRASVAIPSSPGFAIRFLVASFATSVVTLFVVAIAFASLGIDIRIAELVLFVALLQVGNVLNLTPGNIGIQEVSFGALAEGLGLGLGNGLLVSALVRVTGLIALAITAAVAQLLHALASRYRQEA